MEEVEVGGETQFKLVQVEEEKRILIESGCRLLPIVDELARPKFAGSRDTLFVSQLNFSCCRRSRRSQIFSETSLHLRLFHDHKQSSLSSGGDNLPASSGLSSGSGSGSGRGRVYQKLIDVPKFAMFTFAPDLGGSGGERIAISPDTAASNDNAGNNRPTIRLSYRLDESSRGSFEQVSSAAAHATRVE